MESPADDLLDFITSQEHSDDQLDQVLQTYQAYQKTQSKTQTPTRQLNAHLKQTKQSMVLWLKGEQMEV